MHRIIVSCVCLSALALGGTGCQMGGRTTDGFNWQQDIGRYTPHVTIIAKAATINVLKAEPRDRIELVGRVVTVISAAIANEGLTIDPNIAVSQIRALVEANAPGIASDKSIMSIVDVAVSIAVGQVESLVDRYGPEFDQSNVAIELIQAALTGVKDGVDALLMPGGPQRIPSASAPIEG